MSSTMSPPLVLDVASVIAYAVVDESLELAGSRLFCWGRALEPVPCLAPTQDIDGEFQDMLIVHYDDQSKVVGVSGCATVREAKARIERASGALAASGSKQASRSKMQKHRHRRTQATCSASSAVARFTTCTRCIPAY